MIISVVKSVHTTQYGFALSVKIYSSNHWNSLSRSIDNQAVFPSMIDGYRLLLIPDVLWLYFLQLYYLINEVILLSKITILSIFFLLVFLFCSPTRLVLSYELFRCLKLCTVNLKLKNFFSSTIFSIIIIFKSTDLC